MARSTYWEYRLQRWAAGVTVGDGSGYPVMSVLHEDWQPPSPGITPTLKTAVGNDVAQTHRLISQLSERLIATLVAHYIQRLPVADQALQLECEPSTVHARIERAHVELGRLWATSGLRVELLADPRAG